MKLLNFIKKQPILSILIVLLIILIPYNLINRQESGLSFTEALTVMGGLFLFGIIGVALQHPSKVLQLLISFIQKIKK